MRKYKSRAAVHSSVPYFREQIAKARSLPFPQRVVEMSRIKRRLKNIHKDTGLDLSRRCGLRTLEEGSV